MIDSIPQDDPDAFIEYLREQYDAEEGLAEYLELLYEDYYDDRFDNTDRYYEVQDNPRAEPVDIGRIIDASVLFGMVWERADSWNGSESTNE